MITLVDNNLNINNNENTRPRKEIECLFPISGVTIGDLCKQNENLLVFPHCLNDFEDDADKSPIFSLVNIADPEKVKIETGNIMGFFGLGDKKIKIKSRFDQRRDDYFLHYMLQKVFSFNLFDLKHNSEKENVFDFILFMFPFFLKKAMQQGIYREYKRFRYNDSKVKGSIDVGRHIQKNIPFTGKITYSTREYSYDNNMTQLIRHTIEFLKSKKNGQEILNVDRETIDDIHLIQEHTASYKKEERSKIIMNNLRPVSHPYFSEYRPLQKLCLQILRNEEIKFGYDPDETYGLLFDGAWLWEEYVNTILQPLGFKHPRNKKQEGPIYLFRDFNEQDGKYHLSGKRFPDYYQEGECVLDAKYKRLGSYDKVSKVDRNDIHQVITYMNKLEVKKGGFIAPIELPQAIVPTSSIVGMTGGTLSIYGILISTINDSFEKFAADMSLNENTFIKQLGYTF